MNLYVVRHGRTEENAAGILQGQQPGRLSAEGIEQAERVSERLQAISFDAIYSSDLQRTIDTAEAIARRQHVPIISEPLLRERSVGIYEGRVVTELDAAFLASGLPWEEFAPPEGESFRDVQTRVRRFLPMLHAHKLEENILLVSHGVWIRMLLTLAMKMEISDPFSLRQMNTAVNHLEYDPAAGFTVHLVNCTAHLPEPESQHSLKEA